MEVIMKPKKIISMLLAVIMLLSTLPLTAFASDWGEGDTLEEALAEFKIGYHNNWLDWLTLPGMGVINQRYAYFLFDNERTGTVDEHPVFCIDPTKGGAYEIVQNIGPNDDGSNTATYIRSERAGDARYLAILGVGYPHHQYTSLGLQSDEEGYYATKVALWMYIRGNDATKLAINPKYGNSDPVALRVYNAAIAIYNNGMKGNPIGAPSLTMTGKPSAVAVLDAAGEYYVQVIDIVASGWVGTDGSASGAIQLSWGSAPPAGTIVLGSSGEDITSTLTVTTKQENGFRGTATIKYPAASINTDTFVPPTIRASAIIPNNEVYIAYAKAGQTTYQRYLVERDPKIEAKAEFTSQITKTATPPDDPETTTLRIRKLQTGTNNPLGGAVFEVKDPDGKVVFSGATPDTGVIDLPLAVLGNYTVTEKTPPQYHLPAAVQTQSITVKYNELNEVTFVNDPYGILKVMKRDAANGQPLSGATIQIKHIASGVTHSATTDSSGNAIFDKLPVGGYEIVELSAPGGYELDATKHTVNVTSAKDGEVSYTLTNKAKAGLRIYKFDKQTMMPIAGVTFEVWKDGELYGSYVTDNWGEIELRNLPSGTYTAKEVATIEPYVLDPTVQWVEIRAGQGYISELVFLNLVKPGMHLVKLDSVTLAPLPNARYEIAKVGGSYKNEFITDASGEIDLSALEPGAYTVKELAAPNGYLIDDNLRTIQLNAGETAQFVFTNTKKPTIEVIKYDAQNGVFVPGATIRIAKIEDGTHNLDRVTDINGKITISDLEPGVYSVQEIAAPGNYVLNDTEYHVELFPGRTSQLVIENVKKPSLIIWKYDMQTAKPLPDAEFSIAKKGGSIIYEGVTNSDGFIRLDYLDEGWYTITELAPPPGYLAVTESKDVYLEAGKTVEIKFDNLKCPTLTINKVDRDSLEPLSGVRFNVKFSPNINFNGGVVDLGEYITDANGQIILDDNLGSGWYRITELASPPGYVFGGPASKDIFLAGGENKVLIFENIKKPSLIIWKYDLETAEKLPNTEFSIRHKDGAVVYEGVTDAEGKILLTNLDPGYYTITEIAPPPGYLLSTSSSRDVYLEEGKTLEVKFDNLKCPTLTVLKLDSITHDPIKNVRFNVKFSPNVNFTGGVVDMGNYTTDQHGRILLNENLQSGWYRVTEIEPASGYTLKEPSTQDIFLKGGDNKTLTFENIPKSALIIHKDDGINPVPGATFEIRYLAGTSGSGGTLIRTAVTSSNGTITLTGLAPGTYVVEETRPATGHQLSNPSVQTAYISDDDQCVVELHFTNPKMGHLVITKLDSASKLPIAGVTFLVTDSSGAVIGPNNGEYTTDASGVIEITEWLTIGSTINVKEIRGPSTHNMDAPPQSVKIMENTTHRLTFYNSPKSGLQVIKTATDSKTGLKDAHFRLYKASGEVVGDYVTDKDGIIIIPSLEPGWYKLVETKAPNGYILDDKPVDVQITNNQFVRVEVENKALSGLLITKYAKGTSTKQTLSGAVFTITDSEGKVVGNANGRFTTDVKGQILVSGLSPGTYIVTEVAAPSGFRLDPTPQTIKISAGEGLYTLDFYNEAIGGLEILKLDEESRQPIPNTEFSITKMNGERISANTYITDAQGIIRVYGLDDGWYTVTEVKAAKGYRLDATPHNVEVKNGQATPLRLTNRKESSILLHKVDSLTGKGIYGVKFLISDANSNPLMTVESDQNGYVYTTGLADGKYFIREIEAAKGYILDTETKTFYIQYGSTTEILWKNTPMLGQIQVTKKSADDNPINGFPAGTLLQGAVFEIYDRAGNKVDTIQTDKNGWAATKALPLGRYTIREAQAPQYYSATQEAVEAEIEFSSQIVRVTVLNKSVYTNVSVTKRGYTEVVPGQSIRYDFKNIANNSTVALDSFYWRDTLPTDAVRLDKIITGTWSAKLSYKIVYKTNLSGGTYRTLSDNLSTEKVYTIAASPAALGLAANEYVTEVMFVFGRVPAGFKQVETPYIYCTVLPNLAHEYRFTNKTDVGGLWGNQWIMANDRWVTVVYNKTTPPILPRTGY